MKKLYFIINSILFGIVYARQIGLIANHVYTYEPSVNNFSITAMTFENTSSCNACICAAFMSTIDYVAINCYKDNNTCYLLTVLVNITGIISSGNNSLYILSYTSIPVTSVHDSTSLSSTLVTALTSTTSSITSSSTTLTTATIATSVSTKKCVWGHADIGCLLQL